MEGTGVAGPGWVARVGKAEVAHYAFSRDQYMTSYMIAKELTACSISPMVLPGGSVAAPPLNGIA